MSESWAPPWADPFLAREQVMADMAACVRTSRDRRVPCRMYVHGLEGLGVSCLVTQFSKTHRELIDGPLVWLTGRDPDGRAVAVGDLLARALRQLGCADVAGLATDADKVDAYRALARSRKFLLALDDMDNRGQLVNLVPEDAPGAIVVATSTFERRTLRERGFQAFTPEFLPPEHARTLFRAIAGPTADELEATTLDALVTLCGGFPLLVKVLAAQIRGRPPRATRLLTQLRTAKLSVLTLDDERRMTRSLDAAYAGLSADHARAYRRLGLLPAADLSVESAAAALEIEPDDTFLLLEQLTEFNLLTATAAERYALHPVLRADARARAEADDEPDERRNVLSRWISWYVRAALPHGAVISNRWWVEPVLNLLHSQGDPSLALTRPQALAWFDIESANIAAAIRAAHRAGEHDHAWPLCVALWKYLHLHGLHDAWIETHRDGLDSARAARSEEGVLQLASQLGAAYLEVREYREARRCFTESLDAARRLGHALGTQSALEWLGKILARQGNPVQALDLYEQSWAMTAAASDTDIAPPDKNRIRALLRLHIARARIDLGHWDEAVEDARRSLTYFDQFDNETDNRAKTRLTLGIALLARGDTDTAVPTLEQALAQFQRESAARHAADTRRHLGYAYRAAGQFDRAQAAFRAALDYYREVGSPRADELANELDHPG